MKPKHQISNCLSYETTILPATKPTLSLGTPAPSPKCLSCKFPFRPSSTGSCQKMCPHPPKTPTTSCPPSSYCKTLSKNQAYCQPAPLHTNCRIFNAGPSYAKTGCSECKKTFFRDPENNMCTQDCGRFCRAGSTCEVCGENRLCSIGRDGRGACRAPAGLLPHCLLY